MHPCLQVKNENVDMKTCFLGIENLVGDLLPLEIALQVAPKMMQEGMGHFFVQNLAGDLLCLEIVLWRQKCTGRRFAPF